MPLSLTVRIPIVVVSPSDAARAADAEHRSVFASLAIARMNIAHGSES